MSQNELTLSDIWLGSLVICTARSLLTNSDRQTEERGGQNLRERKR